MIATMNVFDRDVLFRLSYALMRRFAFIEVESPADDVVRGLLAGPGALVAALLPVRELVDLGPALFVDSAHFAARRLQDPDASLPECCTRSFTRTFCRNSTSSTTPAPGASSI